MSTFTISNDSTDFGTFEGETPAHALAAMHRAAGYASAVIDGVVVPPASAIDADGASLCPGIDGVTITEVSDETTYSVTFTDADTSEAYDAAAQASEEPQTLADVIELCKSYGIAATLRDAAGFIKGYVHGDGSYSLR
jgi:hypothetical protein